MGAGSYVTTVHARLTSDQDCRGAPWLWQQCDDQSLGGLHKRRGRCPSRAVTMSLTPVQIFSTAGKQAHLGELFFYIHYKAWNKHINDISLLPSQKEAACLYVTSELFSANQ